MYNIIKRRIEQYIIEKGKRCKIENVEEAKTIISLQELMTLQEREELNCATDGLSTKLFNNAQYLIYWNNKNKKI
jgi:ribosomal protein L21